MSIAAILLCSPCGFCQKKSVNDPMADWASHLVTARQRVSGVILDNVDLVLYLLSTTDSTSSSFSPTTQLSCNLLSLSASLALIPLPQKRTDHWFNWSCRTSTGAFCTHWRNRVYWVRTVFSVPSWRECQCCVWSPVFINLDPKRTWVHRLHLLSLRDNWSCSSDSPPPTWDWDC